MSGPMEFFRHRRDPLAEWSREERNLLAIDIANHPGTYINLATGAVGQHDILPPLEILEPGLGGALDSLASYTPDPLGTPALREAISAHLARRGVDIASSNLVIGPGTSLLYFHAFRILAGQGGEVLTPSPGYPLFDDLASAAGSVTRRYYLRRGHTGWQLDLEDLEFQITPKTRAICVVSPHNPLGTRLYPEESRGLAAIARKWNLPVIIDEVFQEFPTPGRGGQPMSDGDFPLLIRLDGLSKMLFLPGLKVAWMSVSGDTKTVQSFLNVVERLSDAFLPVSDVAASLATRVIGKADDLLPNIREQVDSRRALAQSILHPWARMPEAGVYLVIPVSNVSETETLARWILRDCDVLVHPGEYYDLPGHLVLCVLAPEDLLREGCLRLKLFLTGGGWVAVE